MIEWPDLLVRDLASRRVAVVIGSGVSKNSVSLDGTRRPPLWGEFLEAALSRAGAAGTRHIKSALKGNDYLHACEWLKSALDENWNDFLSEQFKQPKYQSAEIHEAILNLDQRIYLTPNIDQIFDNYVSNLTHGDVVIKRFCDDDVHNFLRDDRLYIVKLHGSINNENELIFTQEEYASARTRYSAFYQTLDACLLSHTFLFLGSGIEDPDINLLLENHRFSFPYSRPHYFVTSSKMPPAMRESMRRNKNLKCLTYEAKDHHYELTESIKALAVQVEQYRIDHPAATLR